ncbi:hypothetical protein PR202_gb27913 [Eleusine coracana subsp. coracana]|uniref:Uncharacterized protein n=1 Tax=Eleusine coracana subsp. coracana TaxID=191504 RepID=A0AAV5FW90_ELECO|nr:hypothetical protein PR202_gb27913 [Eleusine coracana subsp. coracana]
MRADSLASPRRCPCLRQPCFPASHHASELRSSARTLKPLSCEVARPRARAEPPSNAPPPLSPCALQRVVSLCSFTASTDASVPFPLRATPPPLVGPIAPPFELGSSGMGVRGGAPTLGSFTDGPEVESLRRWAPPQVAWSWRQTGWPGAKSSLA